MTKQGILLFAHGARDPAWAKPFNETRDRLKVLAPDADIELAFLEFMAPNIIEAGQKLAQKGCIEISVVPVFLGAGGHVRKDLPALLEQLQQQFPLVRWKLCPAVGETQILIEALANAALALSTHQAQLLST